MSASGTVRCDARCGREVITLSSATRAQVRQEDRDEERGHQMHPADAQRWATSNPRRIAAWSLLAVLLLLAAATGPIGIGFAGPSAIGRLVPVAFPVRRVHLMASLLVP